MNPAQTNSPSLRKLCATCGRRFEWRRSWERSWDQVKYCSERCRRNKPGPQDRELERLITDLLRTRPRGSSLCPSEVARAVGHDEWRLRMEPVRQAARRLAASGLVEVTQGNRPGDPSAARGSIRVRLKPHK